MYFPIVIPQTDKDIARYYLPGYTLGLPGKRKIQEELIMKENKKESTFICSGCLEEVAIDQLLEFGGRNLCPRCLEEETTVCSVCGERI